MTPHLFNGISCGSSVIVYSGAMDKICKICGTTSATSEFYNSINSRCKNCHKAKIRENRAEKVDYYRAYDAMRFQKDPRVKERNMRYQATEAGKASLQKSRQKWLSVNQVKRAAHIILGNAVYNKKVIRPSICQICGSGGRIHGHHDDYAKPLDVVWCCPKCHTEIHRNLKRIDHE